MEDLAEAFGAEFAVSEVPNDPARKHPHFALYKAHKKRPDQEERRRRLLEEQKKKRSELFNASRGLITLEENEATDQNKEMDWSSSKPFQVSYTHQKLCKDKLMFSEWLVEVPQDLEDTWYMVPCPEGHRTAVVAYAAKTMAFTKAGYRMALFKSLLPGGSHEADKGYAILDCIWSIKDYTYYILDVLSWGNQSVMDCETEFRFYWLQSKLQETHKLGTRCKGNKFVFKSLPYYKCTKDVMTEVMANENMFSSEGPKLDGLLFYHSRTHYTPGFTPLVGWLKPYMMPEVLGVPVAPVYLQEDMETNTKAKKQRHRRKERKVEVEEEMEASNEPLSDADPAMVWGEV